MKHSRSHRKQNGAALVVGLILLVAVTLMALAGMNSSTLDLMMAGNEQFRSRSFAAAETGIEVAMKNGTAFNTSQNYDLPTPASVGSGSDKYTYGIGRPNAGKVEGSPAGYSSGGKDTFGAVYFRITSTGTSERNATSVTVQELFQVVPAPDDKPYESSVCAGTSNLDGATSSC